MTLTKAGNVNTNTVATVTTVSLNSTTATKIADAKLDRIYLSVALKPGTTDRDVYIRLYAAATNDNKEGEPLARRLNEDGSYFQLFWRMLPSNIYTGEASAIVESGSVDVHVTEF